MGDAIRYEVGLGDHVQHLVHVTVHVPAELAGGARLVLPTWTPGSYVVRNYARHVQQVQAADDHGRITPVLEGVTAWRLPDEVAGAATVTFELYANELTVRTSHVDDHHALIVPAATFPAITGATDRPHTVTIHPPPGWRVWSLLPRAIGPGGDADAGTFQAEDYDHLVDSAFEAGDHAEAAYEVAGVPHRFVWSGHGGRPDLDRVTREAAAVGEAAVELFGELPTEQYTFLCVGWDAGGGGLEHRDGAVLMAPVRTWQAPADRYRRFQSLVAHEYLHLWNAKRLTPAALVAPDYGAPTHTPSLWVAEGWTAYYDELLCLRAGLWEVDAYLDQRRDGIDGVRRAPGRALQSVRQASHEAWTKFYVRDENTPNVSVNYYAHGALIAWCLDLELRRRDPEGDGLDAVVRLLWEGFGRTGVGYTEDDVEAAVAEVAGESLEDFFAAYVAAPSMPPIDDLLSVVGLTWVEDEDAEPAPPRLGVETDQDDQGVTLRSVLRDEPAWRAGLTGGDRLVAIDGLRVGRDELDTALRAFRAGDRVEVAVLRGPRLLTLPVILGEELPRLRLRRAEEPTDRQRTAFERWSGQPWEDAQDSSRAATSSA